MHSGVAGGGGVDTAAPRALVWFGFWGCQQPPGSYGHQGGEMMMMKSVFLPALSITYDNMEIYPTLIIIFDVYVYFYSF